MRGLCPLNGHHHFILSVSLQYLLWMTPKPMVHRAHLPGLTYVSQNCSTALQQSGQMDTGGGTQFANSLRAEQGWAGRGAGFTLPPFLHTVLPPPSGLLSDVPKAFSSRESRRTEWMWPIRKRHPVIRSSRQSLV